MSKIIRYSIYTFFLFSLSVCMLIMSDFELQAADYVGDDTCLECHEDVAEKMADSLHMKLADHEFDTANRCETCHGAGSAHAESAGETAMPYNFNEETIEADTRANCVACHNGGVTMTWHDSEHSAAGVLCMDCHDVKAPYQKMGNSTKLCNECHADQNAKFNLPSHHPVREGMMGCNDCHNPHAGTEFMIKGDTVNDLCYTCHAEKQGPFLWEHDPVVEDCTYCHDAKGTMNNNLLVATESSLCLRCHTSHDSYHAIDRWESLGDGYSQADGRADIMAKCTRCHIAVHGSDLDSMSRGAFLR